MSRTTPSVKALPQQSVQEPAKVVMLSLDIPDAVMFFDMIDKSPMDDIDMKNKVVFPMSESAIRRMLEVIDKVEIKGNRSSMQGVLKRLDKLHNELASALKAQK